MNVVIRDDKKELGRTAARLGVERLRGALADRGRANIILATGASQFEMLEALVAADGIDWPSVTAFHLDEYCGMPISHPASFRKYLRERVVDRLPQPLAAFHFLDAETDPAGECERVGELLRQSPIDVAFVGIGENGHLAFNDPPADFDTDEPYLLVDLDEKCRLQQVGEGWFACLDDVPTQAVSMSIRQIMKSKAIVCTVPDLRKADAVRATVEGDVSPLVPASILREHGDCHLVLDVGSASLLSGRS